MYFHEIGFYELLLDQALSYIIVHNSVQFSMCKRCLASSILFQVDFENEHDACFIDSSLFNSQYVYSLCKRDFLVATASQR